MTVAVEKDVVTWEADPRFRATIAVTVDEFRRGPSSHEMKPASVEGSP